eukprot:scaffold5289_cov60-Phaeocystis_antarctica.AAC.1
MVSKAGQPEQACQSAEAGRCVSRPMRGAGGVCWRANWQKPLGGCFAHDFMRRLQALTAESIARWTSTRPIVLGEEAVPWNARTASATGAAATIAST